MTRHNPDDVRSKSNSAAFFEVLDERISRRSLLKGAGAVAAATVVPGFVGSIFGGEAIAGAATSSLTFSELRRVYDEKHHVAPGYSADVLARWGDMVTADSSEFDVTAQTATSQSRQFGYNNDFVAYLPLPQGSNNSDRGLLYANHEYPNQ